MQKKHTYEDKLKIFPDHIKSSLYEFCKYLADCEADYIILMARSAVRLYDLVSLAGGKVPEATILYSTCLDHDLSFMKGKRIVIADDTLICGTTLCEAKKTVELADSENVETVVFMLDQDWHVPDLIVPDKVFIRTSSEKVLEFCAHEVDAFSISAIPYVTDFPLTLATPINSVDIDTILQMTAWNCHLLSNSRQEEAGAFVYSYLPAEILWGRSCVLAKYRFLIDLLKVRMFVKESAGRTFVKFVPIVTFFPIQSEDLDCLFNNIVEDLQLSTDGLLDNCLTSSSKLRFCQYALSTVLGALFSEDLAKCLESSKSISLDFEEAIRIFGHAASPQLAEIHQHFDRGFVGIQVNEELSISKSETPAVAKRLLDSDLHKFVGEVIRPEDPDELDAVRNIYTDITAIFSSLYTHYELPARLEAQRLGKKIFDIDDDVATHRGRLKIGLSWDDMVAHLCDQEGLGPRRSRSQILSLMLDRLIDLGVAVPIIAERSGIVFRAYRHGETVPITNEFLFLIYEMANSFLEANGRTEIPKLTFEKILVALVRIGIASEFIQSSSIRDSFEDMARVDYYRHGAVVVVGSKDLLFSDGESAFVSKYLVKRGVLKRTPKNEGSKYLLGNRPDAAIRKAVAPTSARNVGFFFGKMCRAPGSGKRPILDEEGLTAIATCVHPRDLSGAILALIKISIRWIDENFEYMEALDTLGGESQRAFLKDMPRSPAYQAVNSAYLKVRLYREERAETLINDGEKFLRQEFGEAGSVLADNWAGWWGAVFAMTTNDERVFFERLIGNLIDEVLRLAIAIFFVEIALAASTMGPESAELKVVKTRIRSFLANIKPFAGRKIVGSKGLSRLIEISDAGYTKFDDPDMFDRSVERLISARAHANSISRVSCDEMNEYGRASPRTDFHFVLWYDIINSMTQKFDLSNEEKADYKKRVDRFRGNIWPVLDGMIGQITRSKKIKCSISTVPPELESADDEKAILFAGQRAEHFAREMAEVILKQADACGVEVRMIMINANFAGRAPFRYHGRTKIHGTVFWEYFSRAVKEIEAWEERATLGRRPPASLFWRGGELAADSRRSGIDFVENESTVSCTIENGGLSLGLNLCGGFVEWTT